MEEKFGTLYNCDGSKFIKGGDGYGTLIKGEKIFDGEFKREKLQGSGCERTLYSENNLLVNDFIGSFRNGQKNGEGQCFHDDGIYEGDYKRNIRSGRGIMRYKSGVFYIGEWKNDVHHGVGVLVKANGSRFEGSFMNGMKQGEGTYYHCSTGQIQKGIWINDVCKCSMLQDDEIRFRASSPTSHPIPELKIYNPTHVVTEQFQRVLDSISPPDIAKQSVN